MSSRVSLGRVIAVTAGLVGVGALVGAAIGGAIMAGMLMVWSHSGVLGALLGGALLGGGIGAITAPLLAWIFLRRASLGRAILETAIGTLVGGLLGVFSPFLILPAAILGFLVAAINLYVRTRRKQPAAESSPRDG